MHERYSPNFQIPYRPAYDTARIQIEGDLLTLEEKLRRRREMEDTGRMAHVLAKEQEMAYYHQARLAEEEARQLAALKQESAYRHHLLSENEHLQRIELLKKERDNLQREKEYMRPSQNSSPYKPAPLQQDNADDDELIKRYEDGSKAKEYYKDLQVQSNRKEQESLQQKRQRERQEVSRLQINSHHKSQAAFTERKPSYSKFKKEVFDTPYDIIANTVKKDTLKRSPLVQELEKEFNKIEEEKGHHRSDIKFSNTAKVKDSSPLRMLEESIKVYKGQPVQRQPKDLSPGRGINKYQSMGKFAPYRSKSALSPMKKSQDGSYLQSRKLHMQSSEPKPTMKEIELSALKKIQNRLRVSKVMYEDSQFRNIKYEENHLFNTFEIESRQRKDIKGKVNSHPMVLKKHALVC